MSEPRQIKDPSGWDKPWPFAAEVSLWEIPTEEAPAAIEWELARERRRIAGEVSTVAVNDTPWLELDDKPLFSFGDEYDLTAKEFALKTYEKDFARPPAVEIASCGEALLAMEKAEGPKAIHRGRIASDHDRRFAANLLGIESMHSEGLLVTLKLDPAQGREAIRKGFATILKELDLPNGSGRKKQAKKNLRALAVSRAKEFSAGDFMRFAFAGTPYRGTVAAQKERLREARKLLEWG